MSAVPHAETCATPVTKPQRTTRVTRPTEVSRTLTGVRMSATEALDEFRDIRQRITHLLLDVHSWAHPGAAKTLHLGTPLSDPSASQGQQQSTNTHTKEVLRHVQTTLEDTHYLLMTCQKELDAALARASSGQTSTTASAGISHANSPYHTQSPQSNLLQSAETAEATERRAEDSCVVVRTGSEEKGVEPAEPTAEKQNRTDDTEAITAAAAPQNPTAEHPTRITWPSPQFCYVVHVEFKRGRVRRFFSPFSVTPGSYAIVPGDRGYDCGLLIQCALWNPYKQAFDVETVQSLDETIWPPGTHNSILEMIRVATDEEVHRLHNEHVSMERLALNTCRDVAARLHLPMQVIDCEYQYDGTKISFFFDSTATIDFRNLNKELYRIFNARIWMQNTNGLVRNMAPLNATVSRRWRSHGGNPCSDS